jgi:trimeric autotransporter adhesin
MRDATMVGAFWSLSIRHAKVEIMKSATSGWLFRLCSRLRSGLVACSLLSGVSVAMAQCQPQWLPGDGVPGVMEPGGRGSVRAIVNWDPDGAGPATPLLVVAGSFSLAGRVVSNNIAAYDPLLGAWSALGSGTNGVVHALAVLPNGELVAGGEFTVAGGATADRIARWNGSTWSTFGSGMNDLVQSLAVQPNGDLVVGGVFTTADGTAASRIARWDGSAWSALGSGVNGGVASLAVLPNGNLVVGGGFTIAGGAPANRIASWDGSAWSTLGSGIGSFVRALTVQPNGDLVAAGFFTTAGGTAANNIARWDGSTWSPLGSGLVGLPGIVQALTVLPNGDLVAGGTFTIAGGTAVNHLARWDGSTWSPLVTGLNGFVLALTVLPNGDLVVGGGFTNAGGTEAFRIARWNGSVWSALGSGLLGTEPSPVANALTALPNGDVVAGGAFTTAGGLPANCIARWNGSSWSALGSGMSFSGSPPAVYALTVLPNGDLVAGGMFTTAGGTAVNHIARWNGSTWSALGSGMTGTAFVPVVYALTVLPNGDLVAGGQFPIAGGVVVNNIARWNGSSWSALGSGTNEPVMSLAVLPNGDLVAGGGFTTAGGVPANRIARWNGSSWSALGSGTNPGVASLAVLPNGDLVAGGTFTAAGGVPANHIARWNGSTWSALGSGMSGVPSSTFVSALTVLPTGDLVAGGTFTTAGGAAANRIARWDGSSWSALGSGMDSDVKALAVRPNGDLAVCGLFTVAGGSASANFARYASTCPATAVTTGTACPGSGGPNTYTATSLPWIGTTFRARSTTIPSLALVGVTTGFAPISIPLASLLPPSAPACNLLVTPDLTELVFASTGAIDTQLAIPDSVAIAGLQLHQQLLLLEFDPSLAFVGSSSSNSLRLVIGAF